MDQKTKDTIKALSLKTVANGATASEEETAKRMILRLTEKTPSEVSPIPVKKNLSANDTELLYHLYLAKGFTNDTIVKIDWDVIARKFLKDRYDYTEYISKTHTAWDSHNNPTAAKRIKLSEYRLICYNTFVKLYKNQTK